MARQGGHRKRARCDEPEEVPEVCPLATGLLLRWAWGSMSATELQHLAALAKLSGLQHPEVDFTASIGAAGNQPNHCSRALYRKYCKHVGLLPAPELVQCPIFENKGDRQEVVVIDMPIILPHDWLHMLGLHYPDEAALRLGTADAAAWWAGHDKRNPKLWQNPILDFHDWEQTAVPLPLHGDGARFHKQCL